MKIVALAAAAASTAAFAATVAGCGGTVNQPSMASVVRHIGCTQLQGRDTGFDMFKGEITAWCIMKDGRGVEIATFTTTGEAAAWSSPSNDYLGERGQVIRQGAFWAVARPILPCNNAPGCVGR